MGSPRRQELRLPDAYQAAIISLPLLAGRRKQLTAHVRHERAHAQALLADLERSRARVRYRLHAATFATPGGRDRRPPSREVGMRKRCQIASDGPALADEAGHATAVRERGTR